MDVSEPHLLLIDQVVKTWPPPLDNIVNIVNRVQWLFDMLGLG